MNVLHVIANPRPAEVSKSKMLALEFFTTLTENNSEVIVNNVDLYQSRAALCNRRSPALFLGPGGRQRLQPEQG